MWALKSKYKYQLFEDTKYLFYFTRLNKFKVARKHANGADLFEPENSSR